MIICDGTFSVENLTSFQYFASGTCRYFLNSWHVGCCASWRPLEVEFDSTVTRTGTLSWTAQCLDMCAGPVFSLVFLSQSWSVFLSCDISSDCPHPWFKGAPLLPWCLAICVCTAKEHVSDHLHALHYHLILTRGSGAALAAVKRVSGLLHLSGTNVDLW